MVTKFVTSFPMGAVLLSMLLFVTSFFGPIILAVEIHPALLVTMPAGFWLSYKLFVLGDETDMSQRRQVRAVERQQFIDELADKLAGVSGGIRAEKFRNSIHDSMDYTEIKAVYTALLGC